MYLGHLQGTAPCREIPRHEPFEHQRLPSSKVERITHGVPQEGTVHPRKLWEEQQVAENLGGYSKLQRISRGTASCRAGSSGGRLRSARTLPSALGRQVSVYLKKGIQTAMAQGRSTTLISMIKWIRTSRLSIKNFLFPSANEADSKTASERRRHHLTRYRDFYLKAEARI